MDPSRRISLTKLADALRIHRNTLRMYLKKYNVDYSFSNLSDEDLDLLVKSFRSEYPDSGIRYLVAFLRRHRLRIQKRRITSSISRVDRLGHSLRQRQRRRIRRRHYHVTRPNALWHLDGHHKLIHWGIVIHGCVDGYSRTVRKLYKKNCIFLTCDPRLLAFVPVQTTWHQHWVQGTITFRVVL